MIQVSNTIDVDSNCNSITFSNTGTGVIYIDKFPLSSNQTISITGNANEICVNKFKILFTVGASGQACTVIRKTYI